MVDDDILIYVNFIRACPEKNFPHMKTGLYIECLIKHIPEKYPWLNSKRN